MFDPRHFNVDHIADTLYDPAQPGGILLPRFLSGRAREELLSEIERNAHLFRPAPRQHLNALQEFDYFDLAEADRERAGRDFAAVFRLKDSYLPLYQGIARRADFSLRGGPNAIAIHRYDTGSLGLTPHRDESKYINLIAIFVLAGQAPLGISVDRQKSEVVELDAGPGDLVLLRAPRDPNSQVEKKLRPMHYVGRVTQRRYSLTFRECIEQ